MDYINFLICFVFYRYCKLIFDLIYYYEYPNFMESKQIKKSRKETELSEFVAVYDGSLFPAFNVFSIDMNMFMLMTKTRS